MKKNKNSKKIIGEANANTLFPAVPLSDTFTNPLWGSFRNLLSELTKPRRTTTTDGREIENKPNLKSVQIVFCAEEIEVIVPTILTPEKYIVRADGFRRVMVFGKDAL